MLGHRLYQCPSSSSPTVEDAYLNLRILLARCRWLRYGLPGLQPPAAARSFPGTGFELLWREERVARGIQVCDVKRRAKAPAGLRRTRHTSPRARTGFKVCFGHCRAVPCGLSYPVGLLILLLSCPQGLKAFAAPFSTGPHGFCSSLVLLPACPLRDTLPYGPSHPPYTPPAGASSVCGTFIPRRAPALPLFQPV